MIAEQIILPFRINILSGSTFYFKYKAIGGKQVLLVSILRTDFGPWRAFMLIALPVDPSALINFVQ